MDFRKFKRNQSRRSFLLESAGGIGMMAFWHLLSLDGLTAGTAEGLPELNPLKPKPPHFTPRAKNVIYLFMAGAPSHLDLFDPKPEMKKWEGQSLPESMRKKFGKLGVRPAHGPRSGPARASSSLMGSAEWNFPISCPIWRLAPTTFA